MDHIMACRICLSTDVKLYDMCKYRLITAFENLSGLDLAHLEQYPHHLCVYCATMLSKFMSFRGQCAQSQRKLEVLLSEHVLLTTDHIKHINRTANIGLPYTVQFIHNFDSLPIVKEEKNYDNNDFKADFNEVIENYSQTTDDYDDAFVDDSYLNDNCNIYNREVFISKSSDTEISNSESFGKEISDGKKSETEVSVKDKFSDHDESDEEPLSKKAKKKKQKKTKKNVKCPSIIIKTENNDTGNANSLENISALEKVIEEPQNYENAEYELVILSEGEQIKEVLLRKESPNYQNSVYKCDKCFKGFMTEATFNNHMVRHDPSSGSEVCPICHTRWPDARSLRSHVLIAHERKYTCKMCSHVSQSNHKAKEHVQWHKGYTFNCKTCGVSFEKSTSYLTHVRLQHPSSKCCEICGESFIGRNGLNMHLKKAHKTDKSHPSAIYECGSCNVQFKNKDALKNHTDLAVNGTCDTNLRFVDCSGSGSPATLTHVGTSVGSPSVPPSPAMACEHCGDNFTTEELLKNHVQMHRRIDAKKTCAECSRTFANERCLSTHYQRAHCGLQHKNISKPRNCVCEICGYKCITKATLIYHQRKHTGEKPYECTVCSKRFSIYQRLQIHVRTHTGERPFKCGQCPKAFMHKAALNRHDRVHTGVKPYTCPQCGKSFSQSNSMKQHCAGVHMKTYIYSRRSTNKHA